MLYSGARRSRNFGLIVLLVAGFVGVSAVSSSQVRVWEGTLQLPSYEEGPPDANPPFDLFASARFNYPYTLREDITDRRAAHDWRAIYLENEYLKCSVLPDIGGHVYTCVDKISGQPMFYANPSIKKAQIGYRGAWAAFGIEFNFPVSHNWVSMSPVNWAYSKHPDGSASVTVGNIDRVYGMEWTVELLLRPGSTVLEQRVNLTNRSDVRHRFYWWSNAGVRVWDDSRVEYSMRFVASHGFTEVQKWPVDSEGSDLSVIRNQTKGPVSFFVHGSREPFMGIWHPATNTGIVHFAEYADLPAKKIWSWGVDADGLDWRRALSDDNSAYVEVQGGLFRNQETYAFLEPRQTIGFTEFWMPVRGINGISRANLDGIIHLERSGSNAMVMLDAALNINQRVAGASVHILDANKTVFEENVELTPEKTWSHSVRVDRPSSKYSVEVRDHEGHVLLRHTEDEYDWVPESQIKLGPQASYPIPAADLRTEDDWVELGKQKEWNGDTLRALAVYREGLSKFPQSFALTKCAGRLEAGLLRYDEAVRDLEAVHSRDTSDPEIAYYLGIALDGTGETARAQTALEAARRMPQFAAGGALKLAELRARAGDRASAERYLSESLETNVNDLRAAEELTALLRADGDVEGAHAMARKWLARFPLSYFLREQAGISDYAFLGSDPERVLAMAAQYGRLGLYQFAVDLLARNYPKSAADRSEPGALLPQDHPVVAYVRGYYRTKLGETGDPDYAKARLLSTAYVFPDGAQALEVLRAVTATNPDDAKAHYLLGTLYFAHGLADEALNAWGKARKGNAQIPVLHASMGLALLRVKNDPEKALAVFREGVTVDPTNTQIYSGLDQTLSLLARPATERVAALERYPDAANMPAELVYALALNRAEANDFEGATALFRERFFPRQEGGTNVRQVWIEVRLVQTLALGRAGRCTEALNSARRLGSEEAGLAFTRDGLAPTLELARTKFLLGTMEERCDDPQAARKNFEAAAASTESTQSYWAEAAAGKLGLANETQQKERLKQALADLKANGEAGSSSSYWLYSAALLEEAVGDKTAAKQHLNAAILAPDRMLAHHLSRLAASDALVP